MNGCKGIFRVSVDVYPYYCRELEYLCEGDKFSLFTEVPTSSGQASVTESRVTIAYPAKCMLSQIKMLPSVKYSDVKCSDVRMASRLVTLICLAQENLIHNL
jgi:hypothetical protein